MITGDDEARLAAEQFLEEEVRPSLDVDVLTTSVREFETCWVVSYNTRVYIETGAVTHSLAGGPLIVNRATGVVRLGLSGSPAEEQLDP